MAMYMSLLVRLEGRVFHLASVISVSLAAGCLAQASASPLDAAAADSPAMQSSALQQAADAGPTRLRYPPYPIRAYRYPYLYPVEAYGPAPIIYVQPSITLTLAAPSFHKARQLSCFRPRVIVLGRPEKQRVLPRVSYGAPLPCRYRG